VRELRQRGHGRHAPRIRGTRRHAALFRVPRGDHPRRADADRDIHRRPRRRVHARPRVTALKTGTIDLPRTVLDASHAIAERRISPLELAQETLARVDRLQPRLNAFIRVTPERLLDEARSEEADVAAGRPGGPIRGVPFTVKDLIDVAGEPTTGGGAVLPDEPATADAPVWSRLRTAGATLVGKTNLHEFAFGATNINPHYGAVRNPWDTERISGGSSGGSAAAVASGMGLASIGTDTGGSIRCPAALCGVTGLKPTFGRVPRTGVFPLSDLHDHVGPIARTALDCALILDLIAGPDGRDETVVERTPPNAFAKLSEWSAPASGPADGRRPLAGVRLGVARPHRDLADAVVRDAFDRAAAVLADLGAELVGIDLTGEQELTEATMMIVRFDGTRLHAGWWGVTPDAYGPDLRVAFERVNARPASDYDDALRTRRRLVSEILAQQRGLDGLIGPTMLGPAPLIADFDDPRRAADARVRLLRLTYVYDATGQPAISVPCGFSPDGLPMGLQIAAPPWREVDCLRVAHAYQQVTDWHLREPPLD
jgi:aspartyl-tRNA(Asn)/glutamyl-tRNA(Gln) amidotransferase subunit A